MADESILPGSVKIASHIKALDLMVADRVKGINTNVVLVNLIDTAPAAALPYLAEQFNVMRGYKGWRFMATDADKRALLKRAIELNKFAGTPFAIEEVLKLIGVVGAIEIKERTAILHDRSCSHDGLAYYGNHWAYFRVLLDFANYGVISIDDIRGVILEYKNVRSRLYEVSYKVPLTGETMVSADDLSLEIHHDFSDKFKSSDQLTITIIP